MNNDLFIDLGNSRLKWTTGVDGGMGAVAYDRRHLGVTLDREWAGMAVPDRVWLASVAAADLQHALAEWLHSTWGLEPLSLSVQSVACGVSCGYREPRQLGVDRWMAIIAGYHHSPGGVCVVDCGTATTLDMVDGHGRHLGGFILPGMEMMRDSLLRGTALKVAAEDDDVREWGTSTASCIDLGIRKSVVSLVEHSVERMQAAGVCDPGVVLSGGAAFLLHPYLKLAHEYREALVLEGMKRFVQELKH
ncbi:type III pantothenate kinase [Thiolapillus sp.]